MCLHFLVLKSISHISAHMYELSKFCCRISSSCVFVMGIYGFASSTKSFMQQFNTSGRSFMNIMNKIRPRTLPRGIPLVTCIQCENFPLITTRCFWLDKKSFIQSLILPLMQYPFSLLSSLLCGTLSSALANSKYITFTSSPQSMASVTSSINSNSWVVQDRFALNLCCCFAKRLFDSMWSTILFLIILFISLHITEVKLISLYFSGNFLSPDLNSAVTFAFSNLLVV